MKNINNKINSLKGEHHNGVLIEIFKENQLDGVEKLLDSGKVKHVVDYFAEQVIELSEVKNPQIVAEKFEGTKSKYLSEKDIPYVWVYFPWKETIVKLLSEDDYRLVRHSRNLNLIKPEEQEKFSKSRIAIAGLNVGHPGALCLALEGGAYNLKLADFDELSVANLNRFRASVCDLGMNKSVLATRQILEIDPFYNIELFDEGITPENLSTFLLEPKADLLIEETDNLPLKIKLREAAKEYKIPVIMVTGNGAGLIVDVERYDKEDAQDLLNGYLKPDIQKKVFQVKPGETKFEELMLLLRDFMGKEYLTERLVKSFPEVGKTIAGIPQLSESSFLRGAFLCYFSRKITTGEDVPSGRYVFQISDIKKIQ